MNPFDYLRVARYIADADLRRPRQVSLRRAVSSTYYALFHCLARNGADLLAGAGSGRTPAAWRQTYRALQHGTANSRCRDQASMRSFPVEIRTLGDLFVEMQHKRHLADYDPEVRFRKSNVVSDIERTHDVIADFSDVAAKHRRAFAIHLLLVQRKS